VAATAVDPGDKGRVRVVGSNLQVWSDPDLLEIVLRNLTHNAIKHSKGGQVLLGCRRVAGGVRIEVHDTGPGIPPERIRTLFGEFVQGEGARAGGVGLGLAIVERMCRLLNHPLTVQSTPGRGSVFAVTAPRRRGEAWTRPPEAAASLAGAAVLVADDEPLALDAMRRAFEDAGARVSIAGSAEEVRTFARRRFDLYVFDLNIGGDDGLRLLDEIRDERGPGTCGLIVTGATSTEALNRLRAADQAWLTKPVTAGTLTAAAAAVLGR
jgi:CheY-like chemotaxis protein/anti-sigma regulatory factor (Ser/Thr protein kinase)